MAMDGTYIKDLYHMRILSLVTLDGNNQIVPLSLAIVPTEDYENWKWFLQKVARYIFLDEKNPVIMSNCGKRLVAAVDEIFPNTVHKYCCQHLVAPSTDIFLLKPHVSSHLHQALYPSYPHLQNY